VELDLGVREDSVRLGCLLDGALILDLGMLGELSQKPVVQS
jgi:hypothetical protein